VTAELFGDDLPKTYQTQTDLAQSLPKTAALTILPKVANDTPFSMERANMEALKIQPTSSQKLPEPPPLQKEAVGEEEERLSSTLMQVSLSTQNFAGRLRHFVSAWMSLTAEKKILDTVQHCDLEIGNPNQPWPRAEIQFDSKEKEIINSVNVHMLELGVIEPAVHCPDEYISSLFVRKKKSGKYCMILNLKGLKKHIEKHHFQIGYSLVCCATFDPKLLYGIT